MSISLAGGPKRKANTRKSGKPRNPENPKNENPSFFPQILGISARKPVSRGPPIELHLLGCSKPISETSYFFRSSSDQEKPTKMIPKLLPVTIPLKKTAPGTMPKSKSARLGGP